MSKVQTNLIQAQESLFSLLKEITDKSDKEIKNLSIKFLDQVQKKLSNKSDETLIFESLKKVTHNKPININAIT
jgi:cob(I)alamin adenosyltransferase